MIAIFFFKSRGFGEKIGSNQLGNTRTRKVNFCFIFMQTIRDKTVDMTLCRVLCQIRVSAHILLSPTREIHQTREKSESDERCLMITQHSCWWYWLLHKVLLQQFQWNAYICMLSFVVYYYYQYCGGSGWENSRGQLLFAGRTQRLWLCDHDSVHTYFLRMSLPKWKELKKAKENKMWLLTRQDCRFFNQKPLKILWLGFLFHLVCCLKMRKAYIFLPLSLILICWIERS